MNNYEYFWFIGKIEKEKQFLVIVLTRANILVFINLPFVQYTLL